MPVEDHAVHEKVRGETQGAVYGCWNKPPPVLDFENPVVFAIFK